MVYWVGFLMPDHPLPNKIRFNNLKIDYIDRSIVAFLRFNQQIWDRIGTKLELSIANVQPIWDIFVREIWPIFAPNIRHFTFKDGNHLDNLRRRTSPTILTVLDHLNSIDSGVLLPDVIADDGPNATAGQALTKWLHTPSKDGQPKRLFYRYYSNPPNLKWVNNFKEAFPRATSSASYIIRIDHAIKVYKPFELVNERTKEKLTLINEDTFYWLLKRCPIVGEMVQWENDGNWDGKLNNVKFELWRRNNCIGPLSPPSMDEKADQSIENVV